MWVNNRLGPYICVLPRLCWLEVQLDHLACDLSKSGHFVVITRQICTECVCVVEADCGYSRQSYFTFTFTFIYIGTWLLGGDQLHLTRMQRTQLV